MNSDIKEIVIILALIITILTVVFGGIYTINMADWEMKIKLSQI